MAGIIKCPKAIVTMPPYAPYMKEVLSHPAVSGIRLNTVMPVKETLESLLKRMDGAAKECGRELWVDLKGRQLRVEGYSVPPFTEIGLSHAIRVSTPCQAYFRNGTVSATVAAVDRNRLIMLDGPKTIIGPGESVNIPDPTLEIEGYFTDKDKKYIEAACNAGVKNFMLSYVESEKDVEELKKYAKNAVIAAKIESVKGIDYVKTEWTGSSRLMAARGDMFVEVKMPHDIIDAVETIVRKDKNAIVASRIFAGLADSLEPKCEDIGDVDNLLRMGYRTFMFGDDICMKRESILSGLNLFEAMAERYAI